MKKLILILLIGLNQSSCYSQGSQKFGTKGIDHLGLANNFVDQLQNGQFDFCYRQLSGDYKHNVSLEEFTRSGKFIRNLCSNDPLVHYETRYIGQTAGIDLKKYKGEKVTKDIMPEFDFTLKSMKDNKCKNVTLFLRFESEDSDKIQVLDYFKDVPIHDECSPADPYENPFFNRTFFLLTQIGDSLLFDINGVRGNEIIKSLNKRKTDKLLQALTKNDISNVLKMIAGHGYTFVIVIGDEIRELDKAETIFEIVKGFDHNQFNQKLIRVKSVKQFIANYEAYDPFPTYSKLADR